jgi:hypothetical protein
MNLSLILLVGVIVLIYSLFYTYSNDYGVFLLIVLLLIAGLYSYVYVEEQINNATQKIDNVVHKFDVLKDNLFSILKSN